MIQITDLRHRLLDIPALTIGEGCTAVIGPNGSGKTTLLELCAGMEAPEAGSIAIGGRRPSEVRIGWVGEFPDRTMLFSRTFDEIASSLRFRHRPCHEVEACVRRTAETLGIAHLLSAPVRTLSGGEKTLVALAAALADRPEVLVLDEVDSHLDVATCRRVHRTLQDCGVACILWCTQDMDAAATADRVLFLENGAVRHCGAPDEVFALLQETCFYPPIWRVCR